MQKLTLIRGLPGSGKSTLAKTLSETTGAVHLETDMFFMVDGEYRFDPTRISEAHRWCQDECLRHLEAGRSVVVSNTFTQQWELTPYRALASSLWIDIDVIVAHGEWGNTHGVPDKVIERMRSRWED